MVLPHFAPSIPHPPCRCCGFHIDHPSGYYDMDLARPQHQATMRFLARFWYEERIECEALGIDDTEMHGRGGPHAERGRTSSRVVFGSSMDETGRIVGSPKLDGKSFDLVGALGAAEGALQLPEEGKLSFYFVAYEGLPRVQDVCTPGVFDNLLDLLRNTNESHRLQVPHLASPLPFAPPHACSPPMPAAGAAPSSRGAAGEVRGPACTARDLQLQR